MFKTATVVWIGLCLVATGAFAGTGSQSAGTITLASNSGLYVRVTSPSIGTDMRSGNVCGSAVNTGGITRATTAVKVGERVFLTGGPGTNVTQTRLASIAVPRIKTGSPRKSPEGLGTLLARIFGVANS